MFSTTEYTKILNHILRKGGRKKTKISTKGFRHLTNTIDDKIYAHTAIHTHTHTDRSDFHSIKFRIYTINTRHYIQLF